MDLLILGENFQWTDPTYRGTNRLHPVLIEEESESHEANRMWSWHIEEGGESGVVHDLEQSRRLVETYARLDPPQMFEILEATSGDDAPLVGTEFLGYDL